MDTNEFDEIRVYHDEEVSGILEELIADPEFKKAVMAAIPDVPFEVLATQMRSCKTKDEFQRAFSYSIIRKIMADNTSGVSLDHSSLCDKTLPYTYISNHRDIILDSGFLSVLLVDAGMDTVEIAIGDNLLVYPWIKKLVRVNKSFIVQRALSMRQMLEASGVMSRYMHHTIKDKIQSIWIAQREGRAKNSDDRTQESVLKMLAMGGEGHIIDRLVEMNLVPLAISYEYDPCDFLKAREFQLKRDNPDYRKSQEDDLLSMKTGLSGWKGRVHFQTSPLINEELLKIDRELTKPEIYLKIARLIDSHIFRNYRMYPGNYVAHDLLFAKEEFAGINYQHEDKVKFETYVESQLDKIDLPHKDWDFLREKILEMYANPLTNYLSVR